MKIFEAHTENGGWHPFFHPFPSHGPFTVFVLFAQKPTPTFTLTHHSQTTPWPKMAAVRSSLNHALRNEAFCYKNCRGRIKNNSRTTSTAPAGSMLADIHVLLFPEIANARADRFARHGAWCRKITSHHTWKRLSVSSSRYFVQCCKRYEDVDCVRRCRLCIIETNVLISINDLLLKTCEKWNNKNYVKIISWKQS